MKVSAVGFLFQESVKAGKLEGENYRCIIHKINPDGNYHKSVITSPIIKTSASETVSPESMKASINKALLILDKKNSPLKFIGATIKDGIKETEVHSFISDKLFKVRTKDLNGESHFNIMSKKKTKQLLKENLYV